MKARGRVVAPSALLVGPFESKKCPLAQIQPNGPKTPRVFLATKTGEPEHFAIEALCPRDVTRHERQMMQPAGQGRARR